MTEGEFVIEGEAEGLRRVKVYAGQGDDFFLDLPEGCRITFGYFNPGTGDVDRYGNPRNQSDARKTALRIYAGSGEKNQLAAFLGVKGFRDDSIKLTKIIQRVTVEQRYADDGDGTVEYGGKSMRELRAAPEPEIPF